MKTKQNKNEKSNNTTRHKIDVLGAKVSKEHNKIIVDTYEKEMSNLDADINKIKENKRYREDQKTQAKILNDVFSDIIAPQRVTSGPINPDINPVNRAMQIAETLAVNIPKTLLTVRRQINEYKTDKSEAEEIEELNRQKQQYKKDIAEAKKDKFNIDFNEIEENENEKTVNDAKDFFEHIKGIREGARSEKDKETMNRMWVANGGDPEKDLDQTILMI